MPQMPPGTGYFGQQSTPSTLFPGSGTPSYTPWLNTQIPGLGQMGNAVAGMVAQPLLQQVFGPNFIPSQFTPIHSFYDQHRKMLEYQSMQQAMQQASVADQETYTRLLRGMALTSGAKITTERERAIRTMASDFGAMAPTIAQFMPDTFEQMHGLRGSALLMAQQMFMGGRYAIDPVTGRSGFSADTSSQVAKHSFELMFGPGADITQMRGLGAGRLGQMFDEMQRRGLGVGRMSRDQYRNELAKESASAGDTSVDDAIKELDKLAGPELDSRIRNFEASRISRRLKEMVGVVSAMRDIFGEAGHPDAPMSQLIEGINVLSQGGMNQVSPARLEAMVRETANIARRTGIGLDNMMQLTAGGSALAQQMGINPLFAVQATNQAAAFGRAFGNITGGATAPGRQGQEFVTLAGQRLALQASNSMVANQLSVVRRLEQEAGGFAAGTEAEAMSQAIAAGETHYTFDGKKRLVYDRDRFSSVAIEGLTQNGMNRDDARRTVSTFMQQSAYNERFRIEDPTINELARRLQGPVNIMPDIARVYQTELAKTLPEHLRGRSAEMAQQIARTMMTDMDPGDTASAERVLEASGVGAGLNEADRAAVLRSIRAGYGGGEQMIRTKSRYSGYKSFDALIHMHNTRMHSERDLLTQEARVEADLQTALSGLGRGSALQRLIDSLSKPGEREFKDIAAEVLGFENVDDVARQLQNPSKELIDQIALYEKSGRPQDAQVRRKALQRIREIVPQMRKSAEDLGFEFSGPSRPDVEEAQEAVKSRSTNAFELVDALGQSFLVDDKALSRLGTGGVDLVKKLRSTNQQLEDLANKHAGGDRASLFASREERAEARTLMADIGASTSRQQQIERWHQGVASGKLTASDIADQLRKQAEGVGGAERVVLLAEADRIMQTSSAAELLDTLNQKKQSQSESHKELMRRREDLERRTGADFNRLGTMVDPSDDVSKQAIAADKELQNLIDTIGGRHKGGVDQWKAEGNKIAGEVAKLMLDPELWTSPEKMDRLQELQKRAGSLDSERKTELQKRAEIQKSLTGITDDKALDKLSKSLGVELPEHVRRDIMRSGVLRGKSGTKVRATAEALEQLRLEAERSDMPMEDILFGDIDKLTPEQAELRRSLGSSITGLENIYGKGAAGGREMEKWLSSPGRFQTSSERSKHMEISGNLHITGNTGTMAGTGTDIDGTQPH